MSASGRLLNFSVPGREMLHEVDGGLRSSERVDEVVRNDTDFVPAQPAVEPFARPTLNRVKDQQRAAPPASFQFERLHQGRADTTPLRPSVDQKLVDFCPVPRIGFR